MREGKRPRVARNPDLADGDERSRRSSSVGSASFEPTDVCRRGTSRSCGILRVECVDEGAVVSWRLGHVVSLEPCRRLGWGQPFREMLGKPTGVGYGDERDQYLELLVTAVGQLRRLG